MNAILKDAVPAMRLEDAIVPARSGFGAGASRGPENIYAAGLMREVAILVGVAAWSAVFWPMAFTWMLVGATATLLLLVVRLPYQRVHGWVTAPVFKRTVQLSLTRLRLHYHPRFDPERRGVFA